MSRDFEEERVDCPKKDQTNHGVYSNIKKITNP